MKLLRIVALMMGTAVATLFAACGDDDEADTGTDATPTDAASPAGDGGEVELTLTAENTSYDTDELEADAGAAVRLTLENKDSLSHNFSLYESEESVDPLFEGEIFTGPDSRMYEFTAPDAPGTYHFHCDVHPTQMLGDFVVD